jgi:CheY-like chemotaxis protein
MDTPGARDVPAVALTAYARPADRERALGAGFLRYVTKPVDPAELIAILASILP